MYNMYKHWNDGDRIELILCHKKWEIKIKKSGKYCLFGGSWGNFVEETELEAGDVVIFRTIEKKDQVFVCIFKANDIPTGKIKKGINIFLDCLCVINKCKLLKHLNFKIDF